MSLQREGLVTYEEWEQSVPDALKTEKFWRFIGYQKALFLFDLVWFGLIWFVLVCFCLIWFDLVCFGLIWFDLV